MRVLRLEIKDGRLKGYEDRVDMQRPRFAVSFWLHPELVAVYERAA